jgi:hypothetical protein
VRLCSKALLSVARPPLARGPWALRPRLATGLPFSLMATCFSNVPVPAEKYFLSRKSQAVVRKVARTNARHGVVPDRGDGTFHLHDPETHAN